MKSIEFSDGGFHLMLVPRTFSFRSMNGVYEDLHPLVCTDSVWSFRTGKDQAVIAVLKLWQMVFEDRFDTVSKLHSLELDAVQLH